MTVEHDLKEIWLLFQADCVNTKTSLLQTRGILVIYKFALYDLHSMHTKMFPNIKVLNNTTLFLHHKDYTFIKFMIGCNEHIFRHKVLEQILTKLK